MRVVLVIVAAVIAGAAPAHADPEDAIAEAFGGKAPTLPQLSRDGSHVAIDLSTGLGMSSYSTYEVGFFTPAALEERVTMISHADAEAAMQGHALSKPRLAAASAKITKRLAGFAPFKTHVDRDHLGVTDGRGTVRLARTTLSITEDESKGLDVKWTSEKGVVKTVHVAVRPRQYHDREGGKCGGVPKVSDVWYDDTHARLVFDVVFPGHDTCQDEPFDWHVL